jgi:hypothetical protein
VQEQATLANLIIIKKGKRKMKQQKQTKKKKETKKRIESHEKELMGIISFPLIP